MSAKNKIEKVFDIAVTSQDLRKIDSLIILIENIMDESGEADNVRFYLYDTYERLLQKKSYFEVMHCEVRGEGAQAKMLLIKKFRLDDVGIAKVVAENIGIAENTASNYLNRSKIPFVSFRKFMESTFESQYQDLIVAPDEPIMKCLQTIVSNIEDYMNKEGLRKAEYLLKKSQEMNFLQGEALALTCYGTIMFSQKDEKCWDIIKEAVSKSKKVSVDLYTVALAKKGYMLNNSRSSADTVKLLEAHRRRVRNIHVHKAYIGQFYFHLGIAYRLNKNYKSAKKYMELAYDNAYTRKEKVRRITNIGLVLKMQGKYTKAIKCYKSVFELTLDKLEYARIYNNIANVYIKLNEFNKAYEYVEHAIELAHDVEFLNRKINYYDTLFEIIVITEDSQKKFHNAFEYILSELRNLEYIYENFYVIAECIKKIVSIITRRNADEYLEKLISALKDAIYFYMGTSVEKDIKIIFADTMLRFEESSILRR